MKSPLSCLTQARYGIAWGVTGMAMGCYDTVLNYTKSRIMFGKPLAAFQLTQDKLAYMLTEITKAQLLNWRIVKPQHVSLAKRNNCEIASLSY